MSEPDSTLDELRKKVSDTDRAILQAVNARLELVTKIKAWKESHGVGFLDPAREQAMLQELTAENSGPLSEQGVRDLLTAILDLTKREVA